MFRAHRAHHQERKIVSIQPLVTVTLFWWPCRVQVTQYQSQKDGIPIVCSLKELTATRTLVLASVKSIIPNSMSRKI